MSKSRGFTILELIVAIVILVLAGTVFFIQKRDLEVAKRDSERKADINAIYYNLEDIYYATNKSYPQNLAADVLRGLDPEVFKDPDGNSFGQEGSTYRYEPKDCNDGKCKSYTITADLEYEADYSKPSRNK